jgi:hypothetical protein
VKISIPPKVKAWLLDTGERAGSTFGETFLGPVIVAFAAHRAVNLPLIYAAAGAGAGAALAVVKAAIASLRQNTTSPASLVKPPKQLQQATHRHRPHAKPVSRTFVIPETLGDGGRLGRHVHHDERSRAFAVTPTVITSVVHKRHVPPFDQGNVGSCTGNAMAGALSTAPFGHRFTEARAVKLYEAATALDDVPGIYPPNDTGSSGLAVAKAAQAAGLITRYLHCFDLHDVLYALQSGAVIAGTNWYSGMDRPDRDGLVHVNGAVRGGHEYELVGCDLTAQRILAVNSWATGWGQKGYFSIGFDDFTRLLAEQGDVTVPVH